jgi:glycosyltransferase involved in cell wall biosynthesis
MSASRNYCQMEAAPVGVAAVSARAADPAAARRLLFVSYLYPPSLEIGARTCEQIARCLPLHGWNPTIVTARERDVDEQYLDRGGSLSEPKLPVLRTGRLPHPLFIYRRLNSLRRRESGGGSAPTAGELPERRKGFLRRQALSVLNSPDFYTGWVLPGVLAGLRAIRRSRAELIFSSGPYWTNHLVGLGLSYLTGLPWAAHFRDPWLTGIQPEMMEERAPRIEAALERAVVSRADAVVCVTEEHTALLRQAYPHLPAGKFATIYNGFDGAEWDGLPAAEPGAPRAAERFVITYAGQLYMNRNPQPLLRALRALIDAGEVARERVRVDLVGWCDVSQGRRVSEIIAESGLGDCVNLTGPRSRAETLRRLAESDLLLLLAEDLTIQIPGKTFEYLKAGRPILALTPEGCVSRLLGRTGGGWAANPADEVGIQAILRERYRQWLAGEAGPQADAEVVAGFDRRVLAGRFAELFDCLRRKAAV